MKKKIIIIISVFLSTQALFSQKYMDLINSGETDFNKIVEQTEAYYRNQPKGKGTGYKQFKRWELFNSTRLTNDGKLVNFSQKNFDEYLKYADTESTSNSKKRVLTPDGNWSSKNIRPNNLILPGGGGRGQGRVNCIVSDPSNSQILYAGTPAGGLWRSMNGGSSWMPLTDGLTSIGVSGIAIDPNSPANNRTIYILTGDGDGGNTRSIGVLKSLDNGFSWYKTGLRFNILNGILGYKLVMDPSNSQVLSIATNIGLFKTLDGGVNWTQQPNLGTTPVFDIEYNPTFPSVVYASTATQIWRSSNGGTTFSAVSVASPGIPANTIRIELAVAPSNFQVVYALAGGPRPVNATNPTPGIFNGLFRSTDGGSSFSMISNSPNILSSSLPGNDNTNQANYDLALAVSPSNQNTVIVGGVNTWRTDNADAGAGNFSTCTRPNPFTGVDWCLKTFWNEATAAANGVGYNHADVHMLKYIGNTLYSCTDGGIAKSNDNGNSWDISTWLGLDITQVYSMGLHPTNDIISYGTQDNGTNIYINGGTGSQWIGGDGFETTILNDQLKIGTVNQGFLIASVNNTIIDITEPPDSGYKKASDLIFESVFDVVPVQGTTNQFVLYVGADDVWRGTLMITGGTGVLQPVWTNLSNGQLGTKAATPSTPYLSTRLLVAKNFTNIIYAIKGAQLWRTVNANSANPTWSRVDNDVPGANLPGNNITYIEIDPNNWNKVWVTVGNYTTNQKVYARDFTFSPNSGWQNLSDGLPNLPANCIVYEPNSNGRLYLGMDVGIFYRDASMTAWRPYYNGLPNVIISELEISPARGKLVAATFGRGIWESDLINSTCPDNYNFISISNHEGFESYSASNYITSAAKVLPFSNLNYFAANEINLNEGFEIDGENDTEFSAIIENRCSSTSPMIISSPITGTYAGDLPGAISTVDVDVAEIKNKSSKKFNIFPNPFSGLTTISYTLYEYSEVSLSIQDLLGRQIEVLVDNVGQNEGAYKVVLDGSKLAGGTYVVQLKTGDSHEFKKIVVTK